MWESSYLCYNNELEKARCGGLVYKTETALLSSRNIQKYKKALQKNIRRYILNYVYRYIDNRDGIVKYIGVVCRNTDDCLQKRIYEHSKNDLWCQGTSWKVQYITVKTKNDALALEGHFICLYGTDKWFNKSKTTLGLLSFYNETPNWVDACDSFSVCEKGISEHKKDFFIIPDGKLPYLLAERLFEIKESIRVIDFMLENKDFTHYEEKVLIEDRKILIDGLNKYNLFFDSRELVLI